MHSFCELQNVLGMAQVMVPNGVVNSQCAPANSEALLPFSSFQPVQLCGRNFGLKDVEAPFGGFCEWAWIFFALGLILYK